jgi:hypothetical protein
MADIVITAANVVAGTGAKTEQGAAGAAITAGQWVYRDPSTGKYLLADSNSATVAARTPRGVALNAAALNQPLTILVDGPVTIGGVLVAGVAYYLSDTPGGMCAVADVGSGEYSTVLGMATSAAILDVDIQSSGVAL